MALPANVGFGTVRGTYMDGMGNPVAGKVIFKPQPLRILDSGADPHPVTIIPVPISISLDSFGEFETQLMATDDPDIQPTGWTWNVSYSFTGLSLSGFDFYLPEGVSIDLSTADPVTGALGSTVIYNGVAIDPADLSGLPDGTLIARTN